MDKPVVQEVWTLPASALGRKAIGIYARVSTRHEAQLHSMTAQISALTQQVYHRLEWELADIYIDYVSGKSSFDRIEFQRLLTDCRSHKIGMVLTKSVSRFGRDTVDGLQAIRELKSLGIPVYFELEELNSFQPDFEMHYTLRAAVAQGERESFHDNVASALNHKIQDGSSSIFNRPCYGYRRNYCGDFEIAPEEAENVKTIFSLYLEGYSIIGIIRELNRRGITSPTGKATWCSRSVDTMLSNEKYVGNSVATAALMSDAPEGKQRTQYVYAEHHIGIISDAQFKAVAEEKSRRCNIEGNEQGVFRKSTRYSSKKKPDKQNSLSKNID